MKDASNRMLTTILLIIVWVGIATCGDMLLKSAKGFANWRFAAGAASYASTAFFAVLTFRRQQWGWVILAWNCLSLALVMGLSMGVFHERFTIKRGVAAILLMVAIFMAE